MKIVELMLEYGLVVCGSFAAIIAAECGRIGVLKMLVEHGADLEEKSDEFARIIAGDRRIDDVVEWRYWREGTALQRACRAGEAETVEYLLDIGADGYSVDTAGCSCYTAAKDNGQHHVVKILEARGINR